MLRILLSFENVASTKDICDMFSYLFNKGIYDGGELVVANDAGLIYVSPFRLLSKDGMHVISDTKMSLQLPEYGVYNIVCRAKYSENGSDGVELLCRTDAQLEADSLRDYCVCFGKASWSVGSPIEITTMGIRDVIVPIGGKSET